MTPVEGSVGRFTTDPALVVQTWDHWMEATTGIAAPAAIGASIAALYPDLVERGLLARLRRVAEGSSVEVLAPALHRYFIPCPPLDPASRFEWMRQHVTIEPIREGDVIAGTAVTIEDVTARFERERQAAAELDSQDEGARLRAAAELLKSGNDTALLSSALADESWRVRRVAVDGVAASADESVVGSLLDVVRLHHRNPALLNSALTALGRTRQNVALLLLPLLHDQDADVRTYAALALGLIGDTRAVDALTEALGDPDQNVRFHAIEALGRIGDSGPAAVLTQIARTRDFFLGFPALDALAAIGDPSVAPRLIELLDDPMLGSAVAACIGDVGQSDVVGSLTAELVKDGRPVAAIAAALAKIAERLDVDAPDGMTVGAMSASTATVETGKALAAAVAGASDEELRGLIVVLSWLPFDGIDAALAPLLARDAVRRLVADRLARRGVRAAPFVEPFASSEDDDVRRAAAFILGGIASPTSVPVLLDLLAQHPAPEVANVAIVALGSIGDARAFQSLLPFLADEDATVRQTTVGALSSLAHPDLEAEIVKRLHDPSPFVRETAARLGGYFAFDSCLAPMVAACHDEDPLVRRTAAESLATFTAPEAWEAICTAVSDDADPMVRAAGVRALGQAATGDCTATLLSALRDPNLWVRYYAARAAAQRGSADVDTASALMESLVREHAAPVRVAVIDALTALGVGNLLEPLVVAANDSDDDVSCAAIRALAAYPARDAEPVLLRMQEHGRARQQQTARDALAARGGTG